MRSWLVVPEEDPSDALSSSLRARDARGARDVGLVAQMRLLLRELLPHAARVLDPFAGLGSTWVACTREGRASVGVELDAPRAMLARERGADVVVGDARRLPFARSFDAVLTNVPYFRAGGVGLYGYTEYASYLDAMGEALASMTSCVHPGGLIVWCAENLRAHDGGLMPLAWDLGRVLAEQVHVVDERLLVYAEPPARAPAGPLATDRSHEYVLVGVVR
jgi:hypothetical protein